ncbi:MAG: hypothetical protein V1832_00355, partial [Nitrospirota bacterium]
FRGCDVVIPASFVIPACLSRMLSGLKKDPGLRRELSRTTSQDDRDPEGLPTSPPDTMKQPLFLLKVTPQDNRLL